MSGTHIFQVSALLRSEIASRWPGRERTWDPAALAAQLEGLGFAAEVPLPGGRFGISAAGTWHGHDVVANARVVSLVGRF